MAEFDLIEFIIVIEELYNQCCSWAGARAARALFFFFMWAENFAGKKKTTQMVSVELLVFPFLSPLINDFNHYS